MPFPTIGRLPLSGVSGDATGKISAQFPWSIVAPILAGLVGSLFSKKEDPLEKALEMMTTLRGLGMRAPYQSQNIAALDPVVMRALLSQLGRTANWGWPTGMGIDTSFITNLLNSISTKPVRKTITPGL